jgi:dephospho-CoA kinase
MLKLGITGGIGSGKTLVCSLFAQLGVPIYNADERAKWLVNNHPQIKKEIIENFGEKAFQNNTYNRAYVASIVFKDKSKLQELNAIIHPVVFADWKDFCDEHKASPLVIKEAAIMFETESKNTVDEIALVYAPLNLRLKRVMERDNLSELEVMQKINNQMPEEEKLKLARYIIYNDEQHSLIEQVLHLYKKLSHKE